MTEIVRSSLKDTWMMSVIEVLQNGKPLLDQRGKKTLEVENLIMKIRNPVNHYNNVKSVWLPKNFYFGRDALNTYCEQIMSPEKDGFIYSYGNRLRDHFKIDQINEVIKKLKDDQNSRRAMAITVDPVIDNTEDEIPCLQNIVFLVRNFELHITTFFRSNDIAMAAFSNQYALIHMGCYISDRLGLKMGELVVHSVSAHIYDTDIQMVKEVLEKNGWDINI